MKPQKSIDVANYAVKKMFKKKLIIIPGIRIKFAYFFSKIIPKKLLMKINYNIQSKKEV